jgi:hypothetical protein
MTTIISDHCGARMQRGAVRDYEISHPGGSTRVRQSRPDFRAASGRIGYLLGAFILFAPFASMAASAAETLQSRAAVTLTAERLMIEVSDWLAWNFDLPLISERPAIEFVSDLKLKELSRQNSTLPHDGTAAAASEEAGSGNPGETVALYDNGKRTIFLSDGWTGTSPADQSVLVHEMVHHVQNMAKLTFECFMARERLAYRAQNRWLNRFGLDLESEFQIDPFTVLLNSACM